MREMNAWRTMSSKMTIRVDGVNGPIIPPSPNPHQGLAESTSERAGHLVMRAMTYLDSNREAAWSCLRDASTLLRAEPEEFGINPPSWQSLFRPNGLAAWQAKRAIQYIEGNLGSKMAIQDLADQVALSTSHFSRAFKRSLGCAPMTYVAARRVARAKLMMTSTRERLATIALACGFSDQSHFSRYFGRVVGVSPGLWRRMSTRNPR